ncbi:MAG TPA: hypothetical protein VHR72_02365, partial [Gemmataceae bacterium]|nr:hypothetical protein [Gemmataceae bacterium]
MSIEAGWEAVACPLCDSDDHEIALETADAENLESPSQHRVLRLVRCRDCGMGFLNPRPNSATIGRYYPADYRPYQRANTIRTSGLKATLRRWVRADLLGDPPAIAGWRRWVAKAARPWLRPSRDSMLDFPFEGGGRVLDFGCGAGWLSARLRDRG